MGVLRVMVCVLYVLYVVCKCIGGFHHGDELTEFHELTEFL